MQKHMVKAVCNPMANHGTIRRTLLVVALAIAVVLRTAFFAISVRHVPASSDESIIGLQAKRIATQFRTPLLMMAQPYLFPMEAYAAAPFIRWLPRNAFGARIVPFLLGWVGLAALLAAARRTGEWRDVWPVVLLVLFASPYLTMLQAAYALPGYPSLLALTSLAVAAAVQASRSATASRQILWGGLAGFLAGLACSVTLLALPVMALLVGLMVTFPSSRACFKTATAYALGACAGFSPHLAAKWFFPGAYGAVTQTYPWPQACARLWEPVLFFTLPAVLGGRFPLFPDNKTTVSLLPGADRIVAILWAAVMVLATGGMLARLWTIGRRERRFGFGPADMFVGVSWLSVILFALNRRADSHAYRYLVLAAWAFPFVLGEGARLTGRRGRAAWAAVAVALALLNAAGTLAVMTRWRQPNFARDEASLFDIRPAIQCLDAQDIRAAYASYHVAYRITFATDERILCSQYYNERFYGWPLPYKDEVDAASRVAFVLTDTFALTANQFAEDLEKAGVDARRQSCGDWTIFSEFRARRRLEFPRLRGAALVARADVNPADAPRLTDENPFMRWRALCDQAEGLAVELQWGQIARTRGVALYYNAWYQDRPRSLHVEVRDRGTWRRVVEAVPRDMDRFEWKNGHPVLGNQVQTIYWPAAAGDALRVAVAEPEPGRDWAIGEIEVLIEETRDD